LEADHFDSRGNRAGTDHLFPTDAIIVVEAGRDRVVGNVDLVAAIEKIVDSLVDARLGLDAADDHLRSIELHESTRERGLSPATHRGLLDDALSRREPVGDLRLNVTQPFWVLFGRQDRYVHDLRGFDQPAHVAYHAFMIDGESAVSLLNVDHNQNAICTI